MRIIRSCRAAIYSAQLKKKVNAYQEANPDKNIIRLGNR